MITGEKPMRLKQDKGYINKIIIEYSIIIIMVLVGCGVMYLHYWESAFILFYGGVSVVLFVLMLLKTYMDGKTLIMDSTGLTVKFLFLEKKYKWDEFKTKKIIGDELEFLRNEIDPERRRYIVFSRKNNIDFSSGLNTGLAFSDIYITFRWKNPKFIRYARDPIPVPDTEMYCVDEEPFMAKMHEWNVKIDVSMDTQNFNAYAAEPAITPELLESERKASEAMKNYIQQENEKLRSFIQGYNKCRVYQIQEMMKYGHETGVVVYHGEESMVVRCVYEKNRRGQVNKTFYIENEKYERLEEIGDVLDNYCDEEGFLTVGVVDSSLLDCYVRRQNQL